MSTRILYFLALWSDDLDSGVKLWIPISPVNCLSAHFERSFIIDIGLFNTNSRHHFYMITMPVNSSNQAVRSVKTIYFTSSVSLLHILPLYVKTSINHGEYKQYRFDFLECNTDSVFKRSYNPSN